MCLLLPKQYRKFHNGGFEMMKIIKKWKREINQRRARNYMIKYPELPWTKKGFELVFDMPIKEIVKNGFITMKKHRGDLK